MIGFTDERPPASEHSIRALEAAIGGQLPDAYGSFLSSRDGGDPISNVLIDTAGQPTDVGVRSFLSIARGLDEMTVVEAREYLLGEIGLAWLPIGIIEGGAYLLLGLRPPVSGLIAEVDIAHGGQPEVIAQDFDDLIGRLVDFTPYMPDIDWAEVEVIEGPAAQ
jgi:hypothetical protein